MGKTIRQTWPRSQRACLGSPFSSSRSAPQWNTTPSSLKTWLPPAMPPIDLTNLTNSFQVQCVPLRIQLPKGSSMLIVQRRTSCCRRGCDGCKRCEGCEGCNRGKGSEGCNRGKGSEGCKGCEGYNRGKGCEGCNRGKGCEGCNRGKGCEGCKGCER